MSSKLLIWAAVVVVLLAFAWRHVATQADRTGPRPAGQPVVEDAGREAAGEPTYALEIIGLGVTLDRYRQGKLLDALGSGSPHATIREQDPNKYSWGQDTKLGESALRAGSTMENALSHLPQYFATPVFSAWPPAHNPTYTDGPDNPQIGTAGGNQIGLSLHLFVAASQEMAERPDRLMERVFAFFDEHPDIPYVIVTAHDSMSDRNDNRPPGAPMLVTDGYYVPERPDASAIFVLARRERVDPLRPFAFEDIDEDRIFPDEANIRSVARRLMLKHSDLSRHLPRRAGIDSRAPTVPEWLPAAAAFAQREDIYPKHFSIADPFNGIKHAPKDFKPTPWWPVPFNKEQLADFDKLPSLGFVHRPVFVKTVDADGKPLARRDARAAALAAGWKAALETLPEAERPAAPARIAVATGGHVEQTIALTTVLDEAAAHGGPELDRSKPTTWIDTDARLGNTGTATWFVQMAIGAMASQRDGGASAAINLRDPSEASIVFVTPPRDAARRAPGDPFINRASPSFDPSVYSR